MSSRAHRIALAALEAGHTVAWTCAATTLPRRTVHQLAERAGLAWHQDSDTFRNPNHHAIRHDVADLVQMLAPLVDGIGDEHERRVIRREAALIMQRIDRALYQPPCTTSPTTSPTTRAKRRGPRKATP